MNDKDLLSQFLRDYSLLCETVYNSRIICLVSTNIQPLLGHVATLYWEARES
jgi:hypothetical protein